MAIFSATWRSAKNFAYFTGVHAGRKNFWIRHAILREEHREAYAAQALKRGRVGGKHEPHQRKKS
ncbi:hypothetical protein [Trinickia mobilis]|uniref:hypothetical protein n=1 Tax=Trinickia mobilis TaxID=2816356 RepID=UPI001A8D850E|nr:hypothetical protein [Trinickia mobilis]